MRRRSHKAKRRRPIIDPPDGYDPPITDPDPLPLSQDRTIPPRIKRVIVRKIKEAERELDGDPQAELLDIELKIAKIRYASAIGRWKVTRRHSLKEYVV